MSILTIYVTLSLSFSFLTHSLNILPLNLFVWNLLLHALPSLRILHYTLSLLSRQHAEDEVDKKRIADLQAVNDTLLRLARERAFQDDLKLPLVRVAMDIFNGDADKHSEATQEAAR